MLLKHKVHFKTIFKGSCYCNFNHNLILCLWHEGLIKVGTTSNDKNQGRYGCKISYLAVDTDIGIINNNLPV